MKRETTIAIVVGIGLVGFVILKNVYRLNQRIDEDRAELSTFENDLLTIQFPKNLTNELDTTYLESGELFNTVHGVAGSLSKGGNIRRYSISVARYSKDFTTEQSFHVDSLKRNLNHRFQNDSQQLRINQIDIEGVKGLKYFRRTGSDFERSVIFSLGNNVIGITTKGADSVDVGFDEMIMSLKIKNTQKSNSRHH
jgi:hypothetical protein